MVYAQIVLVGKALANEGSCVKMENCSFWTEKKGQTAELHEAKGSVRPSARIAKTLQVQQVIKKANRSLLFIAMEIEDKTREDIFYYSFKECSLHRLSQHLIAHS